MRKLLVSAAAAASLLVPAMLIATPAAADAPPSGFRRHAHHGPGFHRPYRPAYGHGHRRHRHYGGYRGGGFAIGPSYGGLPPFFPGEGAAAGHLQGTPVMLTFYREAYIGRGLIYNTPPQTSVLRGPALSARY